jgi:hypothetical protein
MLGKRFLYICGRIYVLLFILMAGIVERVEAQSCKHQIGVEIGGGGICSGDLHSDMGIDMGVFYAYNLSSRYRVCIDVHRVGTGGSLKKEPHTGYKTGLFEMSLGADMTFVPYGVDRKRALSPYVGASVALVGRRDRRPRERSWTDVGEVYAEGRYVEVGDVTGGVGLYVGVRSKVALRCEVDIRAEGRFYVSDDIDYSMPDGRDFADDVKPRCRYVGSRGNDIYAGFVIRVSYMWGRIECYCE